MSRILKLVFFFVVSFILFSVLPKDTHAYLLSHDLANTQCNSAGITFEFSLYTSQWVNPEPGTSVFGWYSDYQGSSSSGVINNFTFISGNDAFGTLSVDPSNYTHNDIVSVTTYGASWLDLDGLVSCVFSDPNANCNESPITRTCVFRDLSQVPCIPEINECLDSGVPEDECYCHGSDIECCGGAAGTLSCDPSTDFCVRTQGPPPPAPNLCGVDADNDGSQDVDENGELVYGIESALGCFPVSFSPTVTLFIVSIVLSVGGGLALLLIVIAGIMIQTSAGNPQRLQAGRELLVAAIAGIVLIIFSAFILELIGIDILGIPSL